MTASVHRVLAGVLALPFGAWLLERHPLLAVCSVAVTVALAGLPDLGQWVPRLESYGVTHTVWFAFVTGAAVAAGGRMLADSAVIYAGVAGAVVRLTPQHLAIVGFMIGLQAVIGHLVADFFTETDVRPLRPFASVGGSVDGRRLLDPRQNDGIHLFGTLVLAVVVTATIVALL